MSLVHLCGGCYREWKCWSAGDIVGIIIRDAKYKNEKCFKCSHSSTLALQFNDYLDSFYYWGYDMLPPRKGHSFLCTCGRHNKKLK